MLIRHGSAVPGRRLRPTQSVFLGFLATGLGGTGLLMLPAARSGPVPAGFMDALFTAFSALCVTGLASVDTAAHWSLFGHAVILVLIQLGGLGVMTFASVLGFAVLHRLSLRSRLTTQAEGRSTQLGHVPSLILGVVRISLTVEAAVAAILTLQFALAYHHSWGQSLWLGIFHAVSAFNNAGFSLFANSLGSYAGDPVICLPISAAVILGGLGFPVLMQLRRPLRGRFAWTLTTRLVLWGTAVLLAAGTAFITVLEWDNPRTLGPMGWPEKILAGFFQSVQTRTAGFSSVDIGAMYPSTWLGMDALMFIGAGPAGTGGGVKITTLAVVVLLVAAEIRGAPTVTVFGKTLAQAVNRQAVAVVVLGLVAVFTGTWLLMFLTEFSLDSVLFETISAFGTVGLSTGITAGLPPAGHLVLIVLMFIGRLGPILFASALALNDRRLLYEPPEERPIIG